MRAVLAAGPLLALTLTAPLRLAPAAATEAAQAAGGGDALTPVVVELFTSQGCSSCPPADDLLRALERNQPVRGALIIPLSEHVDYWNRLGWRDPFSSGRFNDRQRAYVEALGGRHLYTPMMVVDGRTALVGNRSIAAHDAVADARKAPKATLAIEAAPAGGDTVRVTGRATAVPPTRAPPDVWVAVTEGPLTTDVTRGENASRTLTHTGVVRSLTWLGALPRPPRDAYPIEGRVHVSPAWRRGQLRLVVLLQEPDSGPIVGAAQTPLG